MHPYTTDSAASRLPEQVEAGEFRDELETGAEGVEVRGAVEVPRDRPAPAPRGFIPSTSWGEGGENKRSVIWRFPGTGGA
jgi:hypothetical protein